jgi:hypothetical protein
MLASGDVIQSFLVGLGFDVDESSLRVFNESIKKAALRVTALYGAINAFAGSMVYAFSKISEGFEEMGYQYHIIAPAINKAIVLRHELLKAYGAAGINIRKVIVDSIKLNMSLAKTKFAMEAIYKSVGSKFFGLLQKQSDIFRKKLYEHMPYIINVLTKLVQTVFKAFDAVTRLGGRLWSILSRVYDFFIMLDKATSGWSTIILGLVAAWRILNLGFLATPLGMLIAGFTALLALWDDFKTFQEGGQSLINWGSEFTKVLTGLVLILGGVAAAFYAWQLASKAAAAGLAILETVVGIFNGELGVMALALAVIEAPIWLIVGAISALIAGLTLADEKWKIFGGGLSGAVGSIGSGALGLLGKLGGGGSPLGSNPTNNTNINANMQTQVTVQGSPNADATARAASQQQMSVNRDFVRNLKGSTR